MARLLIFADTHGETTECMRIIDGAGKIAGIIHAGDCTRDADDIAAVFPDIPMYSVCGNNDWHSRAPIAIAIEESGARIFVTHGHMHKVKYETTLSSLEADARAAGAKLAVFGHTHKPLTVYRAGLTILNPGSARFTKTYAVAEIQNGEVKTQILEF